MTGDYWAKYDAAVRRHAEYEQHARSALQSPDVRKQLGTGASAFVTIMCDRKGRKDEPWHPSGVFVQLRRDPAVGITTHLAVDVPDGRAAREFIAPDFGVKGSPFGATVTIKCTQCDRPQSLTLTALLDIAVRAFATPSRVGGHAWATSVHSR